MLSLRRLLHSGLLLLPVFVRADVHVTGNPYYHLDQCPIPIKADPRGALGTAGANSMGTTNGVLGGQFLIDLTPTNVLMSPKLPLQPDTVRGVGSAKLQGGGHFRAPVYTFGQSNRLVVDPLTFDLLLLRSIDSPLVHAVPVDLASAADSWFPGYHWSILLVWDQNQSQMRHLGWKFASPLDETDFFYAVIVAHRDEEEGVAVAAAAPVAERSRSRVADDQHVDVAEDFEKPLDGEDVIPLLGEAHPPEQSLKIAPRKAEAWMLAAWSSYVGIRGRR